MTSIIKFTLKELNTLINDENSCVSRKVVTQNIAFQPWCLSNLKDSVEKIMDYKIGKFDKELNGIILSYKNVKVLDDLCAIRQDSSEIYSDVQADLYVFQPYVGATLHGIINKKSVTHLGVLVHRVFNVVIPRPNDEPGSKWIGAQASVGQKITFKIVVLDLFGALPYIRGCLDENSLPDDNDNTQCDEIDLTVSHVNFDGTKPKPAKSFVNASKENSGYSETIHNSPCSGESNSKKPKDESKSSKRKDRSKKASAKKYINSDDDSISDVDDDLMTTQANMVEKIMKLDKSQRALGVRPPVGTDSIGISRIDKSKPTKSTFIEVSKLKTSKASRCKDEMEIGKISNECIEEINSAHKQNKKSSFGADLSSISSLINPSKKETSPNVSDTHKKRIKPNHSSERSKKGDASFEINNVPGQTPITTSTPFPDEIVKLKKNLTQSKPSAMESIDLKKKLSFSNVSSDSLSHDSKLQNTCSTGLNDGADISLKRKKRKRKSSDSSANISGIVSDQFLSDVSMRSPHRKKRKKNNSNGDLEEADSNIEANFTLPLSVDETVSKKKRKKEKVFLTGEEPLNGNSSSGSAALPECDDEKPKKHSKKRKDPKSEIAQEIFSQIESDPSLLEEIQLLLKARAKKRKNN